MTMNKQQSLVDWLIVRCGFEQMTEVIEEAKEIEREQRIADYYKGACDESDSHGAQYICESDAEKWYNETYGNNNE